MAEKRGIGFRTSSKQEEEAFAALQAELAKTKTNWETVFSKATAMAQQTATLTDELIKGDPEFAGSPLFVQLHTLTEVRLTMSLVGKLGSELINLHERVARLEKTGSRVK